MRTIVHARWAESIFGVVVVLVVLIEGVEILLGGLHADENFVVGVILALNVFHLEKAVEDASKSVNLIDLFHP